MSYEDQAKFWEGYLQEPQVVSYVTDIQGGRVVGFVTGGPKLQGAEKYRGEITALYVRETFQRKGIGKKLMFLAVKALKDHNLRPIIIWALKESPYRVFYEKLGGTLVDETLRAFGDQKYPIVAYSWQNLDDLYKILLKEILARANSR